MEIRESVSRYTLSRARLDPPAAAHATWLEPARRRGRGAFSWDRSMHGLGVAHEGQGDLTMVGDTVYIFDRKNSPLVADVVAHLERAGARYEFRDIEAFPQYREQMDRVWAASLEGQRPADLDPSIDWGHSQPVVWVNGHTMSGYSATTLDTLLSGAGLVSPRMQTNLIRYGAVAIGVAALVGVGYLMWRHR